MAKTRTKAPVKQKKRKAVKTATHAITQQHRLFAYDYALHGNAEQAAIKAGFTLATAQKKAYRWVGQSREESFYPELWDLVEEIRITVIKPKLENDFNITAEAILGRLAAIAFTDSSDVVSVQEIQWGRQKSRVVVVELTANIPKHKHAAIAEMKQTENGVSIKMHNSVQALELLGRYHGLWKDNAVLQLPPNVTVKVNSKGEEPLISDGV